MPSGHSRRRRLPAGLITLAAIGALALLAGIVWGAVTAPGRQPQPSPAPTTAASALPAPLAARYQARQVSVTRLPGGLRVSWQAPRRLAGITAFIVVADLRGRLWRDQAVSQAARSFVFASLLPGQRYCFVVGTLAAPASGQAGIARTPPVCAVAARR